MLTDLINRTLEIDSYDGAAPGSARREQTHCCHAAVGKACAGLGLGAPQAHRVPMGQPGSTTNKTRTDYDSDTVISWNPMEVLQESGCQGEETAYRPPE